MGDWIVRNDGKDCFSDGSYVVQITDIIGISRNRYKLSNGCFLLEPFSDTYRLWTIEDAKDGDILSDACGNIGIYKKRYAYGWISYCSLGYYFQRYSSEHDNEKTYPATKKQRDILFQKMKEAGYEWDAEKKELKRIKQEPTESPKDYHSIDPHFGISVEDLMTKKNTADNKETKKTMFDKSAEWSEEDENLINSIIKDFETIAKGDLAKDCPQRTKNYIPWFKILKDRVQPQPKQEWSEEDVKTLAKMMFAFKTMVLPSADECNKFIEFLKSIRDKGSLQSTWKPSNEQIKGIECAIKTLQHQLNIGDNRLDSLYDDLKKLREE